MWVTIKMNHLATKTILLLYRKFLIVWACSDKSFFLASKLEFNFSVMWLTTHTRHSPVAQTFLFVVMDAHSQAHILNIIRQNRKHWTRLALPVCTLSATGTLQSSSNSHQKGITNPTCTVWMGPRIQSFVPLCLNIDCISKICWQPMLKAKVYRYQTWPLSFNTIPHECSIHNHSNECKWK